MSSLPLPLLLLIHLQLLQFPHVNEPQYDINLFNSSQRGLKDRIKSMEDICFFLVECCEGTKAGAKKILNTYPCSKPTDSPVFRASLAKYLENTRHSSLRSTTATLKAFQETDNIKTWWKDAIIRKSLLEECAGDKSGVMDVPTGSGTSDPRLATVYFSKLAAAQSTRKTWLQSSAQLEHGELELEMLRARLSSSEKASCSRYETLSITKLSSLRDTRLHDLRRQWVSDDELNFVLQLANFTGSNTNVAERPRILNVVSAQTEPSKVDRPSTVLPLPVAAAHHPSHLRKLHKSIPNLSSAQKPAKSDADSGSKAVSPQTHPLLVDEMQSLARMHSTLKDALNRAKFLQDRLLLENQSSRDQKHGDRKIRLDLWQDTTHHAIDFDARASFEEFAALLQGHYSHDDVPPGGELDVFRSSLIPCGTGLASVRDDLSDDIDQRLLAANTSGAYSSLLASNVLQS
ncbi:hypothetical protein V5O48_000251 [Marasmius crinis-equi]|uniref:HAUS augmin-like complex subunit 6 N-terminal domain-containing protein n=1 Tax=Marasmius crinis-equi TaxID=585013 RepID=A0ABR3G2G3_9AGAR